MKNILIILFSLSYFQLIAQDKEAVAFGSDSIYQEYYLGFSLSSNAAGGLVTFALVKPLPNGKRKVRIITQDDFVYQAKGKTKSPGNPYKEDYFEKYQIKNLNVLNNLWKLRYKEFPYKQKDGTPIEKGWSQNDELPYIPTAAQLEMLKKFGINRISDYFYGENAFKLLEAMQNPEWLKAYKEAY